LALYYEGNELKRLPLSSLSEAHPSWLKETDLGEGYPTCRWASIDISTVAIHPAPAVGGGTLEFMGVAEPMPLVNPGDQVAIPKEFADCLDDYAAHVLMLKLSGKPAADAMVLYQSFMSRMKDLKRFKGKINPQFYVESDTGQRQ
jgi:hypothetical protein